MQILGKRSKILLIAVAIAMLTALGLSFALWDTQAVKASSGNLSTYANAKVGDVIEFGNYYQTANSADKSPIRWIVVDKDERSGQLTLLSEKILAYGSYFGNWYYGKDNATATAGWRSTYRYVEASGNVVVKNMNDFVASIPYNQAWAESNARAFLNNLERFDLGGDIFNATEGLSVTRTNSRILNLTDANDANSMRVGELLPSVGFSNARYWTDLYYNDSSVKNLVDSNAEFMTRNKEEEKNYEVYYQRAKITKPNDRLARNGFLDEAFSDEEMSRIVPRNIPGTISHRWPDNKHFLSQAEYVEGTTDRIWLPSAEELNIKAGVDWAGRPNDSWTTPSDLSSSEAFEYFKNYNQYTNPVTNQKNASLAAAIKTTGTPFAEQGSGLGNYSIPGFVPTEQIAGNTSSYYWTRSPSSYWYFSVRFVNDSGRFYAWGTHHSHIGVRPALILSY